MRVTVVLSPTEFERLSLQARFIASIEEGIADADAGRVMTDAALGRLVDRRYGALAPRRRTKRR